MVAWAVTTTLAAAVAAAATAQLVAPVSDWKEMAALAAVITFVFGVLNAFLSRTLKTVISEKMAEATVKVDGVRQGLEAHIDSCTEKLRQELARKDLTDHRFRELERRTQRLESTRVWKRGIAATGEEESGDS